VGPWEHAMGFALGYHYYITSNNNNNNSDNNNIHIVTMDSYYRPNAEVVAAQQIIQKKGCTVISKHTDPNDVDQYVYSLNDNNNSKERILSMSRYLDMSLFVGDSVVTSHVTDFFRSILPSVESSFLSTITNNGTNGGAMYQYDENNNANETTIDVLYYDLELSPFTSYIPNIKEAELVQQKAKEYLANNNPLCGTRWRRRYYDNDDTNNNTNYNNTLPCSYQKYTKSPNPIESYLDLPNTFYYDSFEDGGEVCGSAGGQYYRYDENLLLSCHPCPLNTYRMEGTQSEEDRCQPCSNGTITFSIGSTYCSPYIQKEYNRLGGIRYYGFALSAIIGLTSIGFAVWVKRHEKKTRHTCIPAVVFVSVMSRNVYYGYVYHTIIH